MGPTYGVTRASSALSTTNDTATLIAPSTRALQLLEVMVGGLGTTSTANVLIVMRSTGGVTGGGAITPSPLSALFAASGVTVNTTWATQPTAGAVLLRLPVNGNGQINRWVATPDEFISIPPSGQISFRSETGTANVSLTVVFREIG